MKNFEKLASDSLAGDESSLVCLPDGFSLISAEAIGSWVPPCLSHHLDAIDYVGLPDPVLGENAAEAARGMSASARDTAASARVRRPRGAVAAEDGGLDTSATDAILDRMVQEFDAKGGLDAAELEDSVQYATRQEAHEARQKQVKEEREKRVTQAYIKNLGHGDFTDI